MGVPRHHVSLGLVSKSERPARASAWAWRSPSAQTSEGLSYGVLTAEGQGAALKRVFLGVT